MAKPAREPGREFHVPPGTDEQGSGAAESLRGGVAIIGLGVIGGSLARALVRHGVQVTGWASSADDRRLAAAAGIAVPRGVDGDIAAARRSATLVLAVPLPSIAAVGARLAARARADVAMLHTAALQRPEALALPDTVADRIFGTHPIAGSHRAGFSGSHADLFAGAAVSVESRASARVRRRAEALWRTAGAARITCRPAEEHDRLMAWVSHLPQLAATALAATLAGAGVGAADTGPGARDTTRLAESPHAMWADILRAAPAETAHALRQLRDQLERLERAVTHDDRAEIARSWQLASAWRRETGGAR